MFRELQNANNNSVNENIKIEKFNIACLTFKDSKTTIVNDRPKIIRRVLLPRFYPEACDGSVGPDLPLQQVFGLLLAGRRAGELGRLSQT